MSEETETISKEAATEIAYHVSAILNNPDTPPALYNAFGDAVNDIYNDGDRRREADSIEYIRNVLLSADAVRADHWKENLEQIRQYEQSKTQSGATGQTMRPLVQPHIAEEFPEIKDLVARIIAKTNMDFDAVKEFMCLFLEIGKLQGQLVHLDDLVIPMNEYLFTFTREFEQSVASYISTLSSVASGSDKQPEQSNAVGA
jgi:hypothetical protein